MRTLLSLALMLSAATAVAQGAPPVRYEVEGGVLKVPGAIVFETQSATLKAESEAALAYVKGYLDQTTYITLLRIEGHTDSDGKPELNQALSEKRALAVARWLIAKGIDCKRLLPVGFGADKPVAPNDTSENKARNRRMAFAPVMLRGKAIGGMPVDGGGRVAADPCAQ